MRTLLFSALLQIGLIGIVSLIGLSAAPAVNAQSNQLDESQKAVLVFDFRMDQLANSEVAKTMKMGEKMKQLAPPSEFAVGIEDVTRIYGAVSAPESVEAMQAFRGKGPLPVEFFVRFELVNAEALNKSLSKLAEKSDAVEIGGKQFYKPREEDKPDNLLAAQVDDKTIEFGTTVYLTRADRKVFTDGLTAAWKKSPEDAIRLALDLEGASELVDAAMEQGKASVPSNFTPFIDLLGAASDLRISIDYENANLLTIGMTGKSESEAEDLEGGLQTLVGFGQMFGTQPIQGIKQQSEELGTMVEGMLNALEPVREGTDVTLAIPHPEGFAEALKAVAPN